MAWTNDMHQITVAEVISEMGEAKDRYWLKDQPDTTATAYPNALNKLCRKLVKLGLSGPAEVRGMSGQLRFVVSSIERLAETDLRDREGGLRREKHRPFTGITAKTAA